MEVHGEHPRGARGGDEVRHQLGADGHPGGHLAVLPGVAVVGDYRGDSLGRGAPERVQHDEQLHQVVVARSAGGLDHEDVAAAHVLLDLDPDLAVAERLHQRLAHGDLQAAADVARQRGIGIARKDSHFIVQRSHVLPALLWRERRCRRAVTAHRPIEGESLAGREGFEPSNTGSKIRGLTTWRPPIPSRRRPRVPSRNGYSPSRPWPASPDVTSLYAAIILSSIILRVSLLSGCATSL